MCKVAVKAFILADSIIGLVIISLALGTFALVRQQCLAQEQLAVQKVKLARQVLNESYQILDTAKKDQNYEFEKLTVKQGKLQTTIYLEK